MLVMVHLKVVPSAHVSLCLHRIHYRSLLTCVVFSDCGNSRCSIRSRNGLPRVDVRSHNALVVTRAFEALIHLVVLAEELPGVRAVGVELLGLCALAIRAPVCLLSAPVLAFLAMVRTKEWFTYVYVQQRAL